MIIADYRTNDGTGVETINSLVSKISAIQAQRWRYRHLVQSQTVHDFFVFCFCHYVHLDTNTVASGSELESRENGCCCQEEFNTTRIGTPGMHLREI